MAVAIKSCVDSHPRVKSVQFRKLSGSLAPSQPGTDHASKKKGSDANTRRDPETSSTDIIRMSRIDDSTIHLQKTVDRKFNDDGGPVAYCPEDAQRAYAASVTKK